MIRTSILVILIVLFSQQLHADIWTLELAVDKALEASNSVKIDKLNADLSYLDAVTAKSGWFPTVSFSMGANIVSDVMEITMPFDTIRFGDYDSYNLNVRFNQLIYDGGKLKALKEASESRSQISSYQAEASELAVEYWAKTAFLGLIMTENTMEASKQSIKEAENHLKDVRALFSQGMSLEIDLLKAQLRIARAQMELVTNEAAHEKARAAFVNVTNLESDETISAQWTEGDVTDPEVLNPTIPMNQRPEIKAFTAALRASEFNARVSRADLYPRIRLFGAFNYGQPGLNLPENKWMHYFSGGIVLNWNAWDWGTSARNSEKALISGKKTTNNRDDFERNITKQYTEARADYMEAQKREKLTVLSEELARRQLELVTVSYREGMATETEYDNAHAAFAKATFEKSVSVVAVHLAKARIEYVQGIRYKGGAK